MAALTDLDRIKAIAQGDAKIQELHDGDAIVQIVLDQVDREVEEPIFQNLTEPAQRYLAAHYLSMMNRDPAGQGALVSESVGGIAQGWALPWQTPGTSLGTTQYGMQFMEYRRRRVVFVAGVLSA